MGVFQNKLFPRSLVKQRGLEGYIEAPPVSVAGTPDSKHEQRIRVASEGRYMMIWPSQIRTHAERVAMVEFYLGVGGRENSFKLLDPREYYNTITAQDLGPGDGVETDFQLLHAFGDYLHTVDKPVVGSVVPYIDGLAQTSRFTVGELTGIITFSADLTGSITAATSASPCKLNKAAHGLSTGDTAHLSTFTGDWAALNGNRYVVTRIDANNFTIPVDTSGFTAYSSNGGAFHTLPQAGETVSADAQHYYQVRFDSELRGPDVVVNRMANQSAIVLREVRE